MKIFNLLKKKNVIDVEYEVLKDYKINQKVPNEVIKKYKDKLPNEVISIWQKYGFGEFLNGYFRIINPDEYIDIVKNNYFRGEIAIPFMTTGLGDIITWEENKFIAIILYRYTDFHIIESGSKYFFNDLLDSKFNKDNIMSEQYYEAVDKYGKLKYDECFGYFPILGTGGKEDVSNLKKVKMKEHIALITQFMGNIG